MEKETLEQKTLMELRKMAKEMGLGPISALKKGELIAKIAEKQSQSAAKNVEDVAVCGFSEETAEVPREEAHQQESGERPQRENQEQGEGILEVMTDGFGFLRTENFLPGTGDIYVSPSQIRRFRLKTGDAIKGVLRPAREGEKFGALIFVKTVNGDRPDVAARRPNFEELTPIYPEEKLRLETGAEELTGRIIDLIAPIGKGQRGMIVAPPKVGKTMLLTQVANAITQNHKEVHLIVLLIDERPEEVTDIQRSIEGENVEIVYSTFDQQPEHHKRVTEMVLERAKRMVEQGKDLVILLDSLQDLQEPITSPFRPAAEHCPAVLTRRHCICPSGSSVQPGISKAAAALPFWQRHWWIRAAKWTKWFSRNSKAPAIWNWCWIKNWRNGAFSRRWTSSSPVPDGKISS